MIDIILKKRLSIEAVLLLIVVMFLIAGLQFIRTMLAIVSAVT